jgi:hypothetical protein
LNATRHLLAAVFLVIAAVAQQQTLLAAGPATVNLRSAAPFTILAGAAITTTGNGVIVGDVGASPITGAAILLTQSQVNGTIYAVDASGPAGSVVAPALLTTAMGDLNTAFNDAAGRLPAPTGTFLNPGAGNLAGLTLVPGLYNFTGTALITGGNVTLSGGPDDTWIFQVAADLEVGSYAQVILTGGAQAGNIFWQVGTSATIGTFAVFKGTILASQAITMQTTSAMDGRALAYTAGVTFDGDVGEVPTPTTPVFASISRTNDTSATIVLGTTPNFKVTLQSSPSLSSPVWTTIATNTPATSPWTFTDTNLAKTESEYFYRAFVTSP